MSTLKRVSEHNQTSVILPPYDNPAQTKWGGSITKSLISLWDLSTDPQSNKNLEALGLKQRAVYAPPLFLLCHIEFYHSKILPDWIEAPVIFSIQLISIKPRYCLSDMGQNSL